MAKNGHFRPYSGPVGGWGSLQSLIRMLFHEKILLKGLRTLWRQNKQQAWWYGYHGGIASYATAAIDIALWDLKGKALGKSVLDLPALTSQWEPARRRIGQSSYASAIGGFSPAHCF